MRNKAIRKHNNIIDTIQSISAASTLLIALTASTFQIEWLGYVAIIAALPALLIIVLAFPKILK